MDKVRVLIGILAVCGLTWFAKPAAAQESPCPEKVDYFLSLYISNGLGNWPYQEWIENSQLLFTEGSGSSAMCHYVGALYSAHPEQELVDPQHVWVVNVVILLAQTQ
jgi:hypothetical protein